MTPKEALNKLDNLAQWYESDVVGRGYEEAKRNREELTRTIDQALTELEELKRYPTADEVCKALSEYINDEVRFIDGKFCYLHRGATSHILDSGVRTFTLEQLLKKPSLITLIGCFYEGLEKGELK